MKELNKKQINLLESAIEKLRTHLKNKYNETSIAEYHMVVYSTANIVLSHCDTWTKISWFATINIEKRTMQLQVYDIEYNPCFGRNFKLFYIDETTLLSYPLSF